MLPSITKVKTQLDTLEKNVQSQIDESLRYILNEISGNPFIPDQPNQRESLIAYGKAIGLSAISGSGADYRMKMSLWDVLYFLDRWDFDDEEAKVNAIKTLNKALAERGDYDA